MASIYNPDADLHVIKRLNVCNSWGSRLKGLLGRNSLGPEEGVWISPCNSIHTFFMRMSIDVVFLDGNLRIVKLIRNMTPFRICMPVRGAESVLEGPVGMIQRSRVKTGARLEFREESGEDSSSRGFPIDQ
jgi:hypothetical protein